LIALKAKRITFQQPKVMGRALIGNDGFKIFFLNNCGSHSPPKETLIQKEAP
jgi:hypothetical protein